MSSEIDYRRDVGYRNTLFCDIGRDDNSWLSSIVSEEVFLFSFWDITMEWKHGRIDSKFVLECHDDTINFFLSRGKDEYIFSFRKGIEDCSDDIFSVFDNFLYRIGATRYLDNRDVTVDRFVILFENLWIESCRHEDEFHLIAGFSKSFSCHHPEELRRYRKAMHLIHKEDIWKNLSKLLSHKLESISMK